MDNLKFSKSNLTKSQYFIWTGQMINPDDPLYNVVFTFDIKGKINSEKFTKAFKILVRETDTLRTIFTEKDGIVNQMVLDHMEYNLEVIDLSSQPLEISSWINERKLLSFDISKCLFDTALIKYSDNGFIWYINQHHLITDAWGNTVIFKNLGAIYRDLLNSSTSEFEINSFSSYRVFEKKSREKGNTQETAFWKEKIKSVSSLKLYGTDNMFSVKKNRLEFEIGFERTKRIHELIKLKRFSSLNQDLALYNVFSTIVFFFLYKITGHQELSFGTPTSNRISKNFKNTPGLFIEFYPLTCLIAENETISSLFNKVKNEIYKLLQNVKPGLSSAEVNRKFNVVFNYINAKVTRFGNHEVDAVYQSTDHYDPRFNLIINLSDFNDSGNFKLQIDYCDQQFPSSIKDFLPDQMIKCIDLFLNDYEIELDDADIIGEKEHEYLLNELNNTDVPYDEAETLLTKFTNNVHRIPNQTAFHFEGDKLTYEGLDIESEKLANHLINKYHLKKGDVVGIFMDRSIEMGIALYGIIKAGCSYLPIDPYYPKERIKYLIKDAYVKTIITQSKFENNLPGTVAKFTFDNYRNLKLASSRIENVNLSQEDVACILYTSGSTGFPKGVLLHHKGICNNLNWLQDTYPLKQKERILQKTPLIWDVSIWEFFWPLQVGAELVIIKPGGHIDPDYLVKMNQKHDIVAGYYVPSLLIEFLGAKDVENCKSLRYVHSGGESLTPKIRDLFFSKLDARLEHQYGVTESAIGLTYWECTKSGNEKVLPIGYPVHNTQLYILNKKLIPNPFGVPGELFVGGNQVTHGYLNRPEATAERFKVNTFSDKSKWLYSTGDNVRRRSDGAIEFLGRLDNQVNLRGVRVELGEIEAKIRHIPSVIEVRVALVGKEESTHAIAAFIKPSGKITSNEIKNELINHLPTYMIPTKIILLDEFPLLENGKIDVKKLVNNFGSYETGETQPQYIAPRNDLEILVSEIWKSVFDLKEISIYDDFLSLGGHSLTAIRIINGIHGKLSINLSVNILFERSTIASLSQFIEEIIMQSLEDPS